jgi:hypothetical protein
VWCAATGTASAAPVNNASPAVAGIAQQGQILTLTPGAWSDATAVTVSDAWESCAGATCSAISPQPGATYTLTPADVGHTIEVIETATATDGTTTATSTPTPTVIALPPVNTAPPTIGGTAQEGQVLTLTGGQWSNSPTVSDQWERCTGLACSPIPGQTAATYTVTSADAGHTLEVSETATNSGGTVTVSSAPTQTIVPPPTEISAPSVLGTPVEGSQLMEAHGSWTGAPTSFAYQWYRCTSAACAPISGAIGQSYTPVAADVGSALLVAEVATNAGGPSAPADSALTTAVTGPLAPVPMNISPPSITGVGQQGQTLNEAHGSWSGSPTAYRYQWDACDSAGCADIPGATGPSHTLTAADVGKSIVVQESALNTSGVGTPAASAPTPSVTTTAATSLAVLPNNPITNQQATLVATVTSGSANAHPSGSLTFFDRGHAIPGCANKILQASAQSATSICQSSFAAGTSQLTVAYSPAAGTFVGASVSAPVTLDVGRDATSTSLAVTKQVQRGKQATYVATIVLPLSNSGPLEPTGAIQFLDHGRPIAGCRARPLGRLDATCVTSYRLVGTHQISARYVGDTNFAPSTSPSRSMRVVEHSSRPAVLGFVSSTLQWQFQYHPTYTVVTGLEAERLATGMTVVLACRGPSCPFKRVRFPVPADASTIDLGPTFHKRRLRPGSEITVRITHSHWIGKYYAFTVRPGRGPVIVLSCLGVGQARPGSGC